MWSGVGRKTGAYVGPPTFQNVPICMATPNMALWRSKKEVNGYGKLDLITMLVGKD